MDGRILCLILLSTLLPTADTYASCRQESNCFMPSCYCSTKKFPKMNVKQIPQMVYFGFDDAVTGQMARHYDRIFTETRTNPNGCPIKMSLYISHNYTDYGLVRKYYNQGHEMAVHSVNHNRVDSATVIRREAKLQKENLMNLAGVKEKDIVGWRSPYLLPAGDSQPEELKKLGFKYDISLTYTRERLEDGKIIWPFTLDYAWPHHCQIPKCPKKSHPGFYAVPVIAMMDKNNKFPCAYVDGCMSPPMTEQETFDFLWNNFNTYYNGSRAPFGFNMHGAWFQYPTHDRVKAVNRFLDTILKLNDVYIVTVKQIVEWMEKPTPVSQISNLKSWSCAGAKEPEYTLNLPRGKVVFYTNLTQRIPEQTQRPAIIEPRRTKLFRTTTSPLPPTTTTRKPTTTTTTTTTQKPTTTTTTRKPTTTTQKPTTTTTRKPTTTTTQKPTTTTTTPPPPPTTIRKPTTTTTTTRKPTTTTTQKPTTTTTTRKPTTTTRNPTTTTTRKPTTTTTTRKPTTTTKTTTAPATITAATPRAYPTTRKFRNTKPVTMRTGFTKLFCRQNVNCFLPKCFCKTTTVIRPIPVKQRPQMILLSFDGPIYRSVFSRYQSIFSTRSNPDNCNIRGTIFLTGSSNKPLIKRLNNMGLEISLKGLTNSAYQTSQEMRNDINSQIRSLIDGPDSLQLDAIKGWRSPSLKPLGDGQYRLLRAFGFSYDSTLVSERARNRRAGFYPFTLDFGWKEPCIDHNSCPKNNYRGIWEVPVSSLEDVRFGHSCKYADGCPKLDLTSGGTEEYLWTNFLRHYNTNRSPFSINLGQKWFHWYYAQNYEGLLKFIDRVLKLGDVYFVKNSEAIEWAKSPKSIEEMPMGC